MAFVKTSLAALALGALAAMSAHAQTVDLGLATEGPGSAVVEELLVVARAPGPAIWLVEKGGAKL